MHDDHNLIETEIATQPIYQGRVVNLQVQTVRLPNGGESKREVIIHPGAVAVVPLLADGQVILIRQFRKPLNHVIWEIPAGTLEPNEDIRTAAERELQEEIGYMPLNLISLGGIHVAPGYSSEFIHIFLADKMTIATSQGDHDEFINQYPMPLTQALAMLYRGEITDAKTVSGLLLAQRYLAEHGGG